MPAKKRTVRQAPIVRAFAERLKGTRLARGMTQRELADKAHVTFSYISRLEAGGTALGIDLLERLAQALQVGVMDLLPLPATPGAAGQREQVKEQFNVVVGKAGTETLSMLGVFLSRLSESSSLAR